MKMSLKKRDLCFVVLGGVVVFVSLKFLSEQTVLTPLEGQNEGFSIKACSSSSKVEEGAIAKIGLEEEEIAKLEVEAMGGAVSAAVNLFNYYAFHERDHQKSFFWASLAEDLGYDTTAGSLCEGARNGVEIEISSRSEEPQERESNATINNKLPE